MNARLVIAALVLMAATAVALPQQCADLEAFHGQKTMNSWFVQSQTYDKYAKQSPAELCSGALECKKLLRPLMSDDNRYKKACPADCSGNGICCGGVCSCQAGFKGEDCSIERCPGNCHSNGVCKNGKCFCNPGFGGDNCDKEMECPNTNGQECNGRGQCTYGKCFCNPGFTGEKCDIVAKCPQDCNNRGLCTLGQCFCNPGFGGTACETAMHDAQCPNDCSGKGVCDNGICKCHDGHFGKDCAQVVECPKGANGQFCNGHGYCLKGQCQCEAGFAGFTCSIQQTCPGNGTCSGNGICIKGSCYCYAYASGDGCENVCEGNCNDKGVCVGGKCKCVNGWVGDKCDKPMPGFENQACPNASLAVPEWNRETLKTLLTGPTGCPNGCSGSGVCLNGTCACIPGFGGEDCSFRVDEVPCPNKCSERGVCVFGKCRCLPGYDGPDCSESLNAKEEGEACPNMCSGQGRCLKDSAGKGHCECYPGFAGPDCKTEIACKDNCKGRGLCRYGMCFCYPGFEGPSCAATARCPGGCSRHGSCFYGKCFCDPYYAGEDCSETPHCPKGCHKDNGVCIGNGQCACKPGFTGVDCSKRLACKNDCSGPDNGLCMATSEGVQCVCQEGWMGEDCSRSITHCEPGCVDGQGICTLGECKCFAGYTGKDCGIRRQQSAADIVAKSLSLTENVATGAAPQEASFRELRHGVEGAVNVPAVAEKLLKKGTAVEADKFEFKETAASLSQKVAASAKSSVSASNKTPLVAAAARFATAKAGECPNDCTGHGICSDGVCVCDTGYEGADCSTEQDCPNDCGANGFCKAGVCYCAPEFSGRECTDKVSKARSFPQGWIIAIIAAVTFFVGIVVGRKTMASTFVKNVANIMHEGQSKA